MSCARPPLALGLACLLLGGCAAPAANGPPVSVSAPAARSPLVGAWRLASLEEAGPDGELHQADCTGLLAFTESGHMSVQVMYAGDHAAAGAGYAQGGYEATFGTYEVDASARRFTYRVQGALVPALRGKELPRVYELAGGRLTITSANPAERWRATWERHDAEQARRNASPAKPPGAARALVGDFAPKLAELTDDVLFGDVWERPQLSKRDRSLITCAALVANGKTEQLGFHVPRALENGVTREEVVELITHLAFYVGWPNAMSAATRARELLGRGE